ncbi:MAG: biotin--[acetyl-CoA-carboxylase] ligase [Acidimicrobiia bacterium]
MPDPQASPPVPVRTVALAAPFTELRWFAGLDSTNRYLLDEARAGAPSGLVVVADHQTAGRGRLGRTWVAPPGASLLTSVLLRPGGAPDSWHRFVTAAGLAMAEAVEATTGVVAGLKWPNDLLVGDRKLAGVLAEVAGDALVVGIGLNVEWHDVPDDLRAIATSCNLEGGRPVERHEILDAFLDRFARHLASPAAAHAAYVARLTTIGRAVRIEQSRGVLVGTARGVDPDGRLLLEREDGTLEQVAVGDVVHMRTAD